MRVLLLRPTPANERFGLGPFFRIEPLGMEYIAAALATRQWSHFDMHHLLWEPALEPRRFFELYCETWRRSVLNLKGRKCVWARLREVDARNALFLLRALRRTQRLMDPAHYLAEYDVAPDLTVSTI